MEHTPKDNNVKEIYAIRSNKTGKYLSNLFEDDHNKTFQAVNFDRTKCYWYSIKSIAENIAGQLNGVIVPFTK